MIEKCKLTMVSMVTSDRFENSAILLVESIEKCAGGCVFLLTSTLIIKVGRQDDYGDKFIALCN